MKKLVFSVVALLAVVLTLTSCGGGGPKGAAQKFLDGLYHLDFAAAREVSTEETKKNLDNYESMHQNDNKEEAKKIKVEVLEPKVNGDNATVEYKLSNDPTVRTLKLVKKNGKWLAEWTKMDLSGAAMDSMNNMTNSATQGAETTPAPGDDSTMAPAVEDTTAH